MVTRVGEELTLGLPHDFKIQPSKITNPKIAKPIAYRFDVLVYRPDGINFIESWTSKVLITVAPLQNVIITQSHLEASEYLLLKIEF